MTFGSGKYTYEYDANWGKEIIAKYNIAVVAGVTVDEQDNVYILTRKDPPVIIIDKNGKELETFGTGLFGRAHGMFRDQDGSLFGVDDARHVVFKFNDQRDVIMTLGTPDKGTDTGYDQKAKLPVVRAAGPFNRPTRLVTDNEGNLYVTDGYGNARVHKFDKNGNLLLSWGEPGDAPGQFNLPHGIGISLDNKTLYVADRQNNRVQLFTTNGEFIASWDVFKRPSDIWVDKEGVVYVSENRRSSDEAWTPSRVTIMSPEGEILARIGADEVPYDIETEFHSAHGVAVDSEGSIYVGNVGQHWPEGTTGLFKYVRVKK